MRRCSFVPIPSSVESHFPPRQGASKTRGWGLSFFFFKECALGLGLGLGLCLGLGLGLGLG